MMYPLANVIEPILFATVTHLVVGNFLIAWAESAVARRWLAVPAGRMYGHALLANTCSATVGAFLLFLVTLQAAPVLLGDEPLRNVRRLTVFIVVAAFVLSVLMEWPFFHAAAPPGRATTRRRSLLACTAAQATSYLLLLPFYAALSTNTLGGWQVTEARDLAPHPGATLLYVSPADHGLYAMPLAGGPTTRLLPLGQGGDSRSDYVKLVKDTDGRHVQLSRRGRDEAQQQLGQFAGSPAAVHRYDDDLTGGDANNPTDLRPERERKHRFYASPHTSRGLRHRERLLAVDLLFFGWTSRCPTILPGDQVVFQWGDQIILADVPGRRLAVLAHGRSPAVALDLDPASFTPAMPATRPAGTR
jgi:hypothetical protein